MFYALFGRRILCTALCASGLLAAQAPLQTQPAPLPDVPPVRARHAMVVTIQHDATDAGVLVLMQGGNAVDAAVAVGFALAVVYPTAGNLGGGGFMLIRPSGKKRGHSALNDGVPHFLDYREMAPAAATRDMYLDAQGKVIAGLSTKGYKASGVPGSVAGLVYAEQHYGRLGLKKAMAPAIALARDGFVLSDDEAKLLGSRTLTAFPESKRVFQRDGKPYGAGERFQQPDLAGTLERIAADPTDFYKGAMAKQIAAHMQANGGLITADDMARYAVKERTPLVGHYRGLEVLTSPPPSSGGIVLLESLNILGGYDLQSVGADRSPAQVQLITEAFRRAYMDRGDYLGDPDFMAMPLKQMADPAYADAWRKTIVAGKPTPSAALVRPAGFMPPPPTQGAPNGAESHETTQYSVVDKDGNAVSTTYTLNFGFGSGVTIPGLGFLMNDEMDDFASKMGVPNGFGLIQGPANAIAPGKRPLSSMTPTMVSTAGKPGKNGKGAKPGQLRLVLGSPGGSTIITTVANDLISVVDNGLNIQQSADAPRFHHQYLPDVLQVEKRFPLDAVAALRAMGYDVKRENEADEHSPGVWGDSEVIAIDPKTKERLGGHDLRRSYGKAAGY